MDKKLGFGCMRLPLLNKDDQTSVDLETFKKLVDTFIEKGFTYFDTALTYHGFKSEDFVREALVKRHTRDEYTLATKLPPRVLKTEEDQERIFNEQLDRCGVEYFDYYLDWENPGIQSRRCYEVARKHKLPISVMEPCKGGNLAMVPAEAEHLMKEYNPAASIPSWAIRFAASQSAYYMNLASTHGKAGDCIGCKKCEGVCPQHLKVSELLKTVSATFDNGPGLPTK
jgi:predicted aldo/keto reductase-like oxidoreductase